MNTTAFVFAVLATVGCVVFEGAEDEQETINTCHKLRIPLRHYKLEGA